jgi:hypothetical protein
MRAWLLLAAAAATAVMPLVACGDGDEPPPAPRPTGAAGVGGSSGTVAPDGSTAQVLPVLGPLTIDAEDEVHVFSAQRIALQTRVSGGAGPYRVSWMQSGGSGVIASSDTLNPTFAAPEVATITEISLTVSVADAASGVATRNITVLVEPIPLTAPALTASARGVQIINAGADVVLGGAAVGGVPPYAYAWTQTGGTPVVIDPPHELNAALRAPAVAADEQTTFVLTVTDAKGTTAVDHMIATVKAEATTPAGPEGLGPSYRPLTASERTVLSCEGEKCLAAGGGTRVVCDERAPFALTTLDVDRAGGVTVQKRCVDNASCAKDWWRETSALDLCVGLLPPTSAPLSDVQAAGNATSCKYCCIGKSCNAALVPAAATTTTCDGDVCYPPR